MGALLHGAPLSFLPLIFLIFEICFVVSFTNIHVRSDDFIAILQVRRNKGTIKMGPSRYFWILRGAIEGLFSS